MMPQETLGKQIRELKNVNIGLMPKISLTTQKRTEHNSLLSKR